MKLTGPWAAIIAALIAFVGMVIGAFLNPFAAKMINQPTPTANPKSLVLEQLPQRIFSYYGNAENLGGAATYNTLFEGTDGKPHYELDYNVPSNQAGYAGLAFRFEEGINVKSNYKSIALTLQFEDVHSTVDLYVKDISGKGGSVRIVSNSTEPMPLHYEFTTFGDVNFNALKEIGINIDSTFSSGHHSVTVHAISFEP